MKTPFDNFIYKAERLLKERNKNKKNKETLLSLLGLAEIFRVLFLQMIDSSKKHKEQVYKNIKKPTDKLTRSDITLAKDSEVQCNINFFYFLEQINILGRVSVRAGISSPPCYNRVRFYRNKIIEHWDEYVKLLFNDEARFGTLWVDMRIVIPWYINGVHETKVNQVRCQELIDEFEKNGIILEIPSKLRYGEQSVLIWEALEKIDPELRQRSRIEDNKKKYIPETLVNKIYRYSFPTPIYNVEEYSGKLAIWFDAISF